MKILHVMAGNQHGGAETACIDMVLAMQEAGHDVGLITRKNPRNRRLASADIPVYTLPFRGRFDIYTPWAMKGILKQFRPEIVQTWMSRAPWKTPRWSKSMGIPEYKIIARLGGYYKLKYFKSADYFTTITPHIKTYLEEQGVEPDKILHINNFAETEEIKTPLNRADYNIPANAPLLLGLGRLHDAKAFDILIKAAAQIPGVYVWIAGEGPARKELEILIEELGVQDRVILLGWRDDRAALFQASTICTFCSRYEPFGTVFVQAWANLTPLICTEANGPAQFVQDGKDGLMVPIDDIDALKTAIETLINDMPLQKTLITNGLKRYQNEFTKEKTLHAYLDFYGQVLKDQQS